MLYVFCISVECISCFFLEMNSHCIYNNLSLSSSTKKKIICYVTNFINVRIVSDQSTRIWLFVKEKNVLQYRFSCNVNFISLANENRREIKKENINNPILLVGLRNGEVYFIHLPFWKELVKFYKQQHCELVQNVGICAAKIPGQIIEHIVCLNNTIIAVSRFENTYCLKLWEIDTSVNGIKVNNNVMQTRILELSCKLRDIYACTLRQELTEKMYGSINNLTILEENEYIALFGEENFLLNAPILCLILQNEVRYLSLKSFCCNNTLEKLCNLPEDCEAVGTAQFSTSFIQDNADTCDLKFTALNYNALVHFGKREQFTALLSNNYESICIHFQYSSIVLAKVAMSENLISMPQAFNITMRTLDDVNLTQLFTFSGECNLHTLPENDVWVFYKQNMLKCFNMDMFDAYQNESNDTDLAMLLGHLSRLDLQQKQLILKSESMDKCINSLMELHEYISLNRLENKFSQIKQKSSLINIETHLGYFCNDDHFYLKTITSKCPNIELLQHFKFNIIMQTLNNESRERKSISLQNEFGTSLTKLQKSNKFSCTIIYLLQVYGIKIDSHHKQLDNLSLNLILPIFTVRLNLLDACQPHHNHIKNTEDFRMGLLFGSEITKCINSNALTMKSLLQIIFPCNINFINNVCSLYLRNEQIIIEITGDNSSHLHCSSNEVLLDLMCGVIEKIIHIVGNSNIVVLKNLNQLLLQAKDATSCFDIFIK